MARQELLGGGRRSVCVAWCLGGWGRSVRVTWSLGGGRRSVSVAWSQDWARRSVTLAWRLGGIISLIAWRGHDQLSRSGLGASPFLRTSTNFISGLATQSTQSLELKSHPTPIIVQHKFNMWNSQCLKSFVMSNRKLTLYINVSFIYSVSHIDNCNNSIIIFKKFNLPHLKRYREWLSSSLFFLRWISCIKIKLVRFGSYGPDNAHRGRPGGN